MAKRGHVIGAIMLAKSGDVAVFGPLSDPRLGALVLDRRWLSDLKKRRISTLNLDQTTYTVLGVPTEAGDLLLFSSGVTEAVLQFLTGVDIAYDVFDYLVSEPANAMTVINRDGQLVYVSPHHESLFPEGIQGELGKPIRDVVENTQLDRVLGTGKEEFGAVQYMDGAPKVVHRSPILRDGKVVGAVGRIVVEGPDKLNALTHRVAELEKEVSHLRSLSARAVSAGAADIGLVGSSTAAATLRAEVAKLAPLAVGVLLHGESGAGRFSAAKALHHQSPRREGPFIPVCLSTLSDTLHEVELFGHASGAIPGGDHRGAVGKLEAAHTGVLYIDEVTALSPALQARLLEVLQRRRLQRIGSSEAREIDVRLVAASTRGLQELSTSAGMHPGFLNFVSASRIALPPLRAHADDVADLALAFLTELSQQAQKPAPTLSEDALAFLKSQAWPGNIRQLRTEIETAFFACDGEVLHASDFMPSRGRARLGKGAAAPTSRGLHAAMDALGMDLILEALERCGGNKKKAAAQLGISRSYLYKRLAEGQA